MNRKANTPLLITLSLHLFATANPAGEFKALSPRIPTPKVPPPASLAHKLEQLTCPRFRALPDDALFEYKGKMTRKGELVAELKRQGDEVLTKMQREARPSSLEALQAKLRREENAKIEAEDTAVRARMAAARRSADANAPEVERFRRDIREALDRAQRPLYSAERVDLDKKLEEQDRARGCENDT